MDPTLGSVIMPFLLGALDPSAVNQTHQAPVAMHTIMVIMKPLLYPSGTVLKYLPQILMNALPGIDTCDTVKTAVTMKLFSVILSWLPLKLSYSDSDAYGKDDEIPQSYLTLVNQLLSNNDNDNEKEKEKEKGENKYLLDEKKKLKIYLNDIGSMISDWIIGFLDKIFALLDAHEEPQKGQQNKSSSGVGECVCALFRSIDHIKEPILWNLIQNKVLEYFKTSTPINAVKISSEMFESLTNNNSSSLNIILLTLLDNDVINGNCSYDRLAFRLRMCGGALRCCQGQSFLPENYAILSQFYTTEYTHHTDKNVRKAVLKLIKDSLKGCISIYPKELLPYDDKLNNVIGAPNNFVNPQYTWYIPSSSALSTGMLLSLIYYVKLH